MGNKTKNTTVEVFHLQSKPVAKIMLNGQNIAEGAGALYQAGAMRSFKLVDGDVYEYWRDQTPLTIKDDKGNMTTIRIFALPAEDGEIGFVEYV